MRVDVSMTRHQVQRRKSAGYAAVCAVGFEADPGVFRLAAAENIEAHLPLIQPGTWHPLSFVRVVWTPGLAIARTLVTGSERWLTDTFSALGQHWFRAELDVLDDLIAAQARSLRTPLWSHAQLVQLLKEQADREADRYARGTM